MCDTIIKYIIIILLQGLFCYLNMCPRVMCDQGSKNITIQMFITDLKGDFYNLFIVYF